MSKWSIGDFAVIQKAHEPPAGVVVILDIAELPINEYMKYFGVELVTTLTDWYMLQPQATRFPGEVFDAHFAELHDVPAGELADSWESWIATFRNNG